MDGFKINTFATKELMQRVYKEWFANIEKCRELGLKEVERRAERKVKREIKKLAFN